MFNQTVKTVPHTVSQIPMDLSDGPWANAWHPVWEDSFRKSSQNQSQQSGDCVRATSYENEPDDQS